MLSIKVRIYLFYVAAVAFVSIGMWLVGAGLFSTGGFTALVVGGLMLATGVVDFAMGRYLQRLYLAPAQQPQPDAGTARAAPDGGNTQSPGGGTAG
ncbi:MAG: hypothetical protein ING90_10070 [Rhodocyclaceae bacterium]|jgi:hypothetical protein|nr:hypothetical protein [Rhodocyclaceae bacterium]MCE2979216.1 hypothetical protein [Betaproteobacteria bacterium]MCA3073381.1 hypothetical protein [Rhodocyclaceae bacterium]MCA3088589.1 hypothetical protein [Rhodocyclaceae bacterium]MCA3092627.1 hypothetical protein [Rhodocyclaceae bacterium]